MATEIPPTNLADAVRVAPVVPVVPVELVVPAALVVPEDLAELAVRVALVVREGPVG